jgi:metal-responsive CopG/Arc/MetJ family transcriptional regulator
LTQNHTVNFGREADKVFAKIDELAIKESSSRSAIIRKIICNHLRINLDNPRYNGSKNIAKFRMLEDLSKKVN